MAKTQAKIRRSLEVVLIILLIGIIGLVGYKTYKYYQDIQNIKENIHENEVVLASLNSQYEALKKDEEEILKDIEELENIETRIEDIRKAFFADAVKADQMVRDGTADFKVCYLTFDDGPYKATTPYFLDVLEEYDVQATFFVLQRDGEEYKDILRREKLNAHAIGNHTDSHLISLKYANSIYRSEDAFIEAIENNREYVYEACGYYSDVMRFPGGSNQATYMGLNKAAIVKRLVDMGYGYADWNMSTGDGGAVRPANEFLHNVIDISGDYDIALILMHDYSLNTLECLPEMIETLKAQGYIFLPLCYDSPTVRKR